MSILLTGQFLAMTQGMNGLTGSEAVGPVAAPERVAAFNAQLDNARARIEKVQAMTTDPVNFAQAPNAPFAPKAATGADARQQTIKALDLPNSAPLRPATEGDAILQGLKKLQGEFRAQQATIVEDMASADLSSKGLMKVQMDMVQYTLTIDIASKITGKITQSVDSLIKGQ